MQRRSGISNPLPGTSSSRRGSNANNSTESVEQNADSVRNYNQVLEQPNIVHEHEQQGERLLPSSSSDGNATMSEKWLGKRPMVEEPSNSERSTTLIIGTAAGPGLSLSQSDGISDHRRRIPPNLDLNVPYEEWLLNENNNYQEAEFQERNTRRRTAPRNMSNSTPENSWLLLSSRTTSSPSSSSGSATVSSLSQPGSGSSSIWLDENWRYVPRPVSLQDIVGRETEQRACSSRNPMNLREIQVPRSTIVRLLAAWSSTFPPRSQGVGLDPSRTNAAVHPVLRPSQPSSGVDEVIIVSDDDENGNDDVNEGNENNNVNGDHQNESEDDGEDYEGETEEYEEENEELDNMRLDVDDMSHEELRALEEEIGDVETGLTEAEVLNGLRRGTCQSNKKGLRCNICLEDYVKGDQIGILHCRHAYHYDCIKQWLVKKNTCPLCKTTAIRICASCGCP